MAPLQMITRMFVFQSDRLFFKISTGQASVRPTGLESERFLIPSQTPVIKTRPADDGTTHCDTCVKGSGGSTTGTQNLQPFVRVKLVLDYRATDKHTHTFKHAHTTRDLGSVFSSCLW